MSAESLPISVDEHVGESCGWAPRQVGLIRLGTPTVILGHPAIRRVLRTMTVAGAPSQSWIWDVSDLRVSLVPPAASTEADWVRVASRLILEDP